MALLCIRHVALLGLALAVPLEAIFSTQGLSTPHGKEGHVAHAVVFHRKRRASVASAATAQEKQILQAPPKNDEKQLTVDPVWKPPASGTTQRPQAAAVATPELPELPAQVGTPSMWYLVGLFLLVLALSGVAYVFSAKRVNSAVERRIEEELAHAVPRKKSPTAQKQPGASEALVEQNSNSEAVVEYWKKTSGMHTVQKWCENYNEHPGGWGALLMIHGIEEVTSRLRSKVENYALYAGLFVAGSIAAIMAPPEAFLHCKPQDMQCQVLKRVFMYGLILGLVAHVLCILLAMAFVNALNETARDADVIRLFARGEGFFATAKCEKSFAFGAICNVLSIVAVAVTYLGSEVLIVLSIVCPIAVWIYVNASTLLFRNASILQYWRWGRHGHDHADDPYDLRIPLECMKAKAQNGLDF